jgi:predicted HAD superfamily phosphohydrolase
MVSLGSTPMMICPCHALSHSKGMPSRTELLGVVAKREGYDATTIADVVNFVRYTLDRDDSPERIAEKIVGLLPSARELAERELREAGKL